MYAKTLDGHLLIKTNEKRKKLIIFAHVSRMTKISYVEYSQLERSGCVTTAECW